jgi:hypothetical protein
MAEIKSNVQSVTEAEKAFYGPLAEAQSLISLYQNLEDDSPYSCLARSVLERLCDCWDKLHSELLNHGYVRVEDRIDLASYENHVGGLGEHPPGSEAKLTPN